jgi:hypothetical protein
MNNRTIAISALFLLLVAGVFAAPIITVDQNVSICNKTSCDNATKVRDGLRNIPLLMTGSITSITVYDQPARVINGQLVRSQHTTNGKVSIFARGMNTTAYRAEVIKSVQDYYLRDLQDTTAFESAQAQRKYPLPSWAPRPGQCDMGIRMTNSMGKIVCVRPRTQRNTT